MARYLTTRHPSPFVLAYGQMAAAALLLVPALIVAGRQPINLDSSVAWSMIALGRSSPSRSAPWCSMSRSLSP